MHLGEAVRLRMEELCTFYGKPEIFPLSAIKQDTYAEVIAEFCRYLGISLREFFHSEIFNELSSTKN